MKEILNECHRILKKSGSIYLHCDSHASHYLKIELDKIFGYNKFRNEIIWRRHNAHSDTKQGARLLGRIHDIILFYSKSKKYTWNAIYQPYSEEYVNRYYRNEELDTGRKYSMGDLSGPGGRANGNPSYEFLGIQRYWRFSKEKMMTLLKEKKIIQTKKGVIPKQKRYLDEMPGVILQDIWDDISFDTNKRFEYPTQKPLRLLERIVELSTNPKDVVLDPFCGSGTTLCAAKNLSRNFIGIDINRDACIISRKRLRAANLRSIRSRQRLTSASTFVKVPTNP